MFGKLSSLFCFYSLGVLGSFTKLISLKGRETESVWFITVSVCADAHIETDVPLLLFKVQHRFSSR